MPSSPLFNIQPPERPFLVTVASELPASPATSPIRDTSEHEVRLFDVPDRVCH